MRPTIIAEWILVLALIIAAVFCIVFAIRSLSGKKRDSDGS